MVGPQKNARRAAAKRVHHGQNEEVCWFVGPLPAPLDVAWRLRHGRDINSLAIAISQAPAKLFASEGWGAEVKILDFGPFDAAWQTAEGTDGRNRQGQRRSGENAGLHGRPEQEWRRGAERRSTAKKAICGRVGPELCFFAWSGAALSPGAHHQRAIASPAMDRLPRAAGPRE